MYMENDLWKYHHYDYFHSNDWKALQEFMNKEEASGAKIIPSARNIFRAFELVDPMGVKVVILGQDPYPNPEHSTGLAFSVPGSTDKLPGTLKNIFRAIKIDLGIKNTFGDLTYWGHQGVLLLNSVLTTEAYKSSAHINKGWEKLTDTVIHGLGHSAIPRVFMLWGSQAQKKKALIDESKHLVLEASHPSPQSAHLGFLWCKHFSKANQFLSENGKLPIDWRT